MLWEVVTDFMKKTLNYVKKNDWTVFVLFKSCSNDRGYSMNLLNRCLFFSESKLAIRNYLKILDNLQKIFSKSFDSERQ